MKVFSIDWQLLQILYGLSREEIALLKEDEITSLLSDENLRHANKIHRQLKYELKKRAERPIYQQMLAYALANDGLIKQMKMVFTVFESELFERLTIYTPIDTGNLISSIYSRHIGLDAIQIGYDTNKAAYAYYVHELDNKHPNGGRSEFLLDAVEEAYEKTMASAWQITDKQTASFCTTFLHNLKIMTDIDRNKLAVTISMTPDEKPQYNYSTVLHLMDDSIAADSAHVQEATDAALYKDSYKLMHRLNNTDRPLKMFMNLSTEGKKKLLGVLTASTQWRLMASSALTSKSKRYTSKSAYEKSNRLDNYSNRLFGESAADLAKLDVSDEEELLIENASQSETSAALAQRLISRDALQKKIIYPKLIEKTDRTLAKMEKDARERMKEQQDFEDETEEYAELLAEEAALAPDGTI